MMNSANSASGAADLGGRLESSPKIVTKEADSTFDPSFDSSFDPAFDSTLDSTLDSTSLTDHLSVETGLNRASPVAGAFQELPGEEGEGEGEGEGESAASPVDDDPELSGLDRQPGEDVYTDFDALFARWKATGDPLLRDRLILSQRSLVTYLARRFIDRGEIFDDVMQIGMVGLINALDAFDPARGIRFSTFAFPSISGEIRRYFRDKVGVMRVPRRMQELYALIQNRAEELTQRFSRSPTYAEIAQSLHIEVEEVIETMELGHALDPQSLDDPMAGDDSTTVSDSIGSLDPDIHAYEEHAALQNAMARLTVKERRALEMAYFDGFSQAEIALHMNVSQMHISRLLRRALSQLKLFLEEV